MNSQPLDKFDESILVLLQRDARQPVSEIAAAVGLSEPACYRRIRRLREDGIIDRDVAVIHPRAMGWPLSMLVLVTLETDRSQIIDALVKRLSTLDEVLDAWYVTGDHDFVLHVIARDMEYFENFVRQSLHSDANVRSFKTLVVMRNCKRLSAVPAISNIDR
ncbi:MAG: Lrp/AsnC family transcriptional regulator [Lysobacteraceae bacterium]